MNGLIRLLLPLSLLTGQLCADSGQGSITGRVQSVTTGEALKSAVVTLRLQGARPEFSRTATSGSGGSFGFEALPPGRYQLSIRKAGYRTIQGSAGRVVLREGQQIDGLVFGLWANGAISGRVLDAENEPVAEAQVRAYSVVHGPNGVTLSPAGRADSDDLGEYRVHDLPAGRYILRVWPPKTGTPAGQFYADTSGTYYPGALSPSQALPVELNWGHDLNDIDLALSDQPTYGVAGAVADAFMEGACTRCFVHAMQVDGNLRVTLPNPSRVSADGSFLLRGLTPGDYKLTARRGSNESMVGQADVSIQNRNVQDVGLIVGLQQEVSGQIVLEDAPDEIDPADWSPYLSPINLPPFWPNVEGEIVSTRRFEIDDVPPADYMFEISDLPPGAYLKALRVGGQRLARPRFTVPNDAPVSGLQGVIAFDGSSVSGQVLRGRSRSGTSDPQAIQARVFLIPRKGQNNYQKARSVEAAPDGSFRFSSVAPGGYALYALPVMSSIQLFDPAVQASLRSYGKQVDLEPEESATVELRLAPEGG